MPRQDQRQLIARPQQAQQIGGRKVQGQVAARGADNVPNYIPQLPDPDVHGFLAGLSQVNPALQRWQDAENDKASEQGKADRMGGVEPQQSNGAYHTAYFATSGFVKAQEDGGDLMARYQSEFDKDKGDLEGWLAENYQGRLKGITDESFISGYNKAIVPVLGQIRQAHLTYQKQAITAEVESNAVKMLDGGISAYITGGQPVPEGYIDSIQGYMGKNLGVSQQRFQELLFETLKKKGDEGHFEVYDLLKQDRPGGAPGLYFDPAWRSKVDAAEAHSYSAFQQRSHQLRDMKQNDMLYPVFAEEDPKKAQQMFNDLKKSGLFTRADDLIKWEKLMMEKVDGKPDANQLEKEGDLLARIYRGGVSYKDILNANARGDLTSGQRKYLLSEARRVQNENQQAAAQAGAKADAIFKTTEYRSAETFLEGMLKPRSLGAMDPMGVGSEFDRAQLATARLELTRAVKGKTEAEIQPIVEEITKRYMKRRTDFTNEQQTLVGQNKVPFKSLQEARDAAAKGLLSPAELRTYIEHFRQGQ